MGCLYLEIGGQSCLVGSVDQGLMKNRQIDLLDRMTPKKEPEKHFSHNFPIATLPGIFQQIAPQKSLPTFRPTYRLFIAIGLIHVIFAQLLWRAGRLSVAPPDPCTA